jgi:uncharacterized protein (TIGR02246 family)
MRITKLALAMVLVLAGMSLPIWASPQNADSDAIKKVFDDFNTAFNNHDAHGCAVLFSMDATFINIPGAETHGSAAVEEHLAPLFSGRLKTSHRDVTMREIKFLKPDVATIDSDYVTTGVAGPNGAEGPAVKGLYDWIMMKQNGHWMIVVWHESNLPVAPTPPPAH